MVRACEPELLDHLPVDDPGAIGSRRDLRRLNAWMGNARYIARALNSRLPRQDARILEIGAGDGTFFLEVAKRLTSAGRIMFLDRQDLVTGTTRQKLQQHGWQAETICADVFEGLTDRTGLTGRTEYPYHAIVANLFLHHFSFEDLKTLFQACSEKALFFIATEPRRSSLALLGGKFIWAIGCNSVTRHDAMVSIRAGFRGELSGLWPKDSSWICEERSAGLWSHLFIARRASPAE
jgi:2-polyprenyl-3-methyl-5-hydroxy-6-metoxy-1,4-benzoquinol methylase